MVSENRLDKFSKRKKEKKRVRLRLGSTASGERVNAHYNNDYDNDCNGNVDVFNWSATV